MDYWDYEPDNPANEPDYPGQEDDDCIGLSPENLILIKKELQNGY